MKEVYPVVLTPDEPGYLVFVPDLDINTQGENLTDAIEMARDAIGLWGITEQDMGREIPHATNYKIPQKENEIVTLIDIDFSEYRKQVDNKAVRKNLTIPNWLNIEAEKAGVNFSKILQEALIAKLGITPK